MEGYIRKAAAQSDDDDEPASSSIVQPKKSEENHYASPRISASSDEQKSLYKRILRGGEIPSGGLQKFLVNQRGKQMLLFEERRENRSTYLSLVRISCVISIDSSVER